MNLLSKNQLCPTQISYALLSAVLFALSFTTPFIGFGFVGLLPLFFVIQRCTSARAAICSGAIFGFVAAAILLSWAPSALMNFFGGSAWIAWGFFLGGSLAVMVQFALMCWFIFFLWKKTTNYLLWALASAAFWVVCEIICTEMYSGAPWLQTALYKGLAESAFLIQWASVGGGSLVSFFVVLLQLLLVGFFSFQRQRKSTAITCSLLLLLFFAGNFFIRKQGQSPTDDATITVAIINENTPADLKWTAANGDKMARNLLALHAEAVRMAPDMLLWSESAVPWTYAPDDDFILEIMRPGIPQILGINSDFQGSKVYNSAYFLSAGAVVQRYDKRYLLSFAEKPLGSGILPFGEIAGFYVQEGEAPAVFSTEKGRIGAFICNESFVPKAAGTLVAEGAEVLMLLSNDGWIDGSAYLLRQHWLSAKIRAVEQARDVVVNCNLGYNGLIRADGSEARKWKEVKGLAEKVSANLSKKQTIYSRFPSMSFLVFVCIFAICALFLCVNKR